MANYQALQTQVGPFPQELEGKPFVFSHEEFCRLHPPKRGTNAADAKKYHAGLIERLIGMKAIRETTDPVTGETPVGPMNMEPKPPTDEEIVREDTIRKMLSEPAKK